MPTINNSFTSLHAAIRGLDSKGRAFVQKNADGSMSIYESGGKRTLLEKFSDALGGRRSAGRLVDKILKETSKKARSEKTLTAIAAARRAAGKSKVAELQAHFDAIAAAMAEDYSADKLPIHISDDLRSALKKSADGRDISKPVALLAKSLADSPICSPDKDKHLPALLEFETQGREALVEALKAACPSMLTHETASRIVSEAYEQALLDSNFPRVVEPYTLDERTGNCVGIEAFKMPDGTEFRRNAGQATEDGSYGSVGFFTATDGSDRQLVVKWIQPGDEGKSTPEAVADILKEGHRQNHAHGGSDAGKQAIMAVHDVVRMPGGRWGLAMEVGPRGSLFELQKHFPDANPNVMKLVASDLINMAVALEKAGQYHGDFREPNMFITQEGKVKLADFGLSEPGRAMRVGQIPNNVTWLAPEALEASRAVQQKVKQIEESYAANVKNLDTSDESNAARRANNREKNVRLGAVKRQGETVDGRKADEWNLGLMIYRTLTGQSRFEHPTFQFKTEEQLMYYKSLPDRQARANYLFPPGSPITDPAQQEAILDLLDPDPLTRKSASEVQASGAFALPPPPEADEAALRRRIQELAPLRQ